MIPVLIGISHLSCTMSPSPVQPFLTGVWSWLEQVEPDPSEITEIVSTGDISIVAMNLQGEQLLNPQVGETTIIYMWEGLRPVPADRPTDLVPAAAAAAAAPTRVAKTPKPLLSHVTWGTL
jgi:hypothetical protein